MAIGITRQIASGTHQQVQIPSGNYPWPTIRILNPNDGVFYVKQNADVPDTGYGSWDYKVPSQSFGLLPGEGQGWQSVGLYYLDQSGSGANGEVSIYLTQQNVNEPVFQSIGRAIVSQTTSMDIVQGSQPANPGAGITRLWSSSTGDLNLLLPNGSNSVVLDSTNFNTYIVVGGDITGPLTNALVTIHYNSYIYVRDINGTLHALESFNGEQLNWAATGGGFRWVNQVNSVQWMALDTNGGLVTAGSMVAGGILNSQAGTLQLAGNQAWTWQNPNLVTPQTVSIGGGLAVTGNITNNGAIVSQQYIVAETSLSANGGIIYFRNDNGIYFQWRADLPAVWTPQSLATSLNLQIYNTGYVILVPNTNNSLYWDTSSLFQVSSLGNPAIYRFYAPTQGMYFDFRQLAGGYTQFGGTNPYLMAPQFVITSSSYSYISLGRSANELAANVHLYVPGNIAYAGSIGPVSTKRVKKDLVAIDTTESLNLILDPRTSSYRYEPIEAPPEGNNEADPKRFGFIAEEMLEVCPEVVILDNEGLPASMDYSQLIPILWGAVRALDGRVKALEPVG